MDDATATVTITEGARWLIRRSEVDRVLAERERVVERRLAWWTPMTERNTAHGYGPVDDEGRHA